MAYGDNRTEVASDAFTDDPLSARFSNGEGSWTDMAYDSVTDSLEAVDQNSNSGVRRDNSESFANDQYCTVTVEEHGGASTWLAARVRSASGTDETAYLGSDDTFGNEYIIYETSTSLGFTELSVQTGADSGGMSQGETITIEAEGSALRMGTNEGSGDTERTTATDATLTSGDPGMYIYSDSQGDAKLGAWSAGDIVIPTIPPPGLSGANLGFGQISGTMLS